MRANRQLVLTIIAPIILYAVIYVAMVVPILVHEALRGRAIIVRSWLSLGLIWGLLYSTGPPGYAMIVLLGFFWLWQLRRSFRKYQKERLQRLAREETAE